ncbi:alpha/beta fold hydrolase [Kibdelosporangium lantanae]
MTYDPEDANRWIRRYHPAPHAPVRLVCFPHAGGSASYYFPVSRALTPDVDVWAVQYPGRQDRRTEPLIDTIESLADAVLAHLTGPDDRPLALFGHSMGATLAFEVALRLERRGVDPVALFASGRRAPSCDRDETFHLCRDDELVAEIERLSGTDARLFADEDIRRMALPAIRSDYRAAETYRYRGTTQLRTPVHVHVGDADPKVSVAEAEAWRRHTSGHFDVEVHRGGHFYLNEHADRLVRSIRQVLDPM